ncbi:MAG: DMT family transporter [Myxococcota bacterium]|nr:DMT family transporter [Myxococcota bacterium]
MSEAASPRHLDLLPAPLLLVFSRALQALSAPIVALLVATAAGLGSDAQDAISFCNVLFVGNLCASGVVTVSFGPRRILADLRGLGARVRLEMLVFGALSAVLSTLIFMGLAETSVTNTVLLARLGPVLYALSGALVLGQAVRGAEWLGFGLIGLGVLATVFVGTGFEVNHGDVLILASTAVYALVMLMSKRLLGVTGVPSLVLTRNLLSAVVFFGIAYVLYGPHHFADAFYGPLWGIMLVYAALVIVAAQLAWYRALDRLTPASVARWAALTPLLAFGYAIVINGERPSWTHVAALACVTVGTLVSNLGRLTPPGSSDSGETSVGAA